MENLEYFVDESLLTHQCNAMVSIGRCVSMKTWSLDRVSVWPAPRKEAKLVTMLFRWVFAFGFHRCGLFSSMVKLCGLKLGSHLRPKTELVVPTSPGESRAGFSPHHSPAFEDLPPSFFSPLTPLPLSHSSSALSTSPPSSSSQPSSHWWCRRSSASPPRVRTTCPPAGDCAPLPLPPLLPAPTTGWE